MNFIQRVRTELGSHNWGLSISEGGPMIEEEAYIGQKTDNKRKYM